MRQITQKEKYEICEYSSCQEYFLKEKLFNVCFLSDIMENFVTF